MIFPELSKRATVAGLTPARSANVARRQSRASRSAIMRAPRRSAISLGVKRINVKNDLLLAILADYVSKMTFYSEAKNAPARSQKHGEASRQQKPRGADIHRRGRTSGPIRTLTIMHKHTVIPLVASLITIAACQLDPKNIGTPDSASEPSTSTDTSASSTETSPVTGSDVTDTSTAGATDTSTAGETDTSTAGETDTGEPLDPVCGLPPDSLSGPSWPENYLSFPHWSNALDEPCVLEATEVTDSGLRIVLDCPLHEQDLDKDTYEFTITAGPLPVLPPIGSTIDAFGTFGQIDISNDKQILILHSEGKLLYAAVGTLTLNPPIAGPEPYAPLTLARVDLCPLKPFSDRGGGDEFACAAGGRVQLRISAVGSDDLLLLEDEAGMIASGQTTYAVDVRRAWLVEDCGPEVSPGVFDLFGFAIAAQ